MKKILGLLLMVFFVVACASKQELSNYKKGIEAMKNKQYEQAIELFTIASNEEQNLETQASSLYNIGFCYGIMKDFDKEIEYYKKSLSVFNDFQPALFDVGKYYYDNKDISNAVNLYAKLVEINPQHESAYYMLALCQIELGNNDMAMGNMQKAAELGSPEAKEFLAKQSQENNDEQKQENNN